MLKTCKFCNNEFNARESRKLFCSTRCYLDWIKSEKYKRRKRICLNCSKEFLAKNSASKFCSFKCSGLYNNKHRKWKIDSKTKTKISNSLKDYAKLHPDCYKKHPDKKFSKYKENICPICGKKFFGYKKTCSKECYRERLRYTSKLKNGGKKLHSGRGKQGRYKGYWCDSSWELAYVIYNLEHNIKFKRYNKYFEYTWNNQILKYYPDFELEDGTLVEIKGYETEQWKAKLNSLPNNVNIIVLNEKSIKPYIQYVINKYGKDFTILYENKKI